MAPALFVSVSDNKVLSTLLALESQLDKLFASQDPTMPDDEVRFRAAVSDLADRELVITISWAKQVPGRCQVAPLRSPWAAGQVEERLGKVRDAMSDEADVRRKDN